MFHLGFQDKRRRGGFVHLQLAVSPPRVKPYSLFIGWPRRGKTSITKRRLSFRWPKFSVIQVGPFLDKVSILAAAHGVLNQLLNR